MSVTHVFGEVSPQSTQNHEIGRFTVRLTKQRLDIFPVYTSHIRLACVDMKQTHLEFQVYHTPFDLLTSLANHGGGELLDHVASFVVKGREVEASMMIGDESGWKPMSIARRACPDLRFPVSAPIIVYSYADVPFTGIASGGMLHLTAPPTDLEVLQLSSQDRISINAFPEVDPTLSERTRYLRTYSGLIKRETVFIRKSDGSLHLTLNNAMTGVTDDGSLDSEDDIASSADVRDMVNKMMMPIQDGVLVNEASSDSLLTLEVVSKSVILRTRVQTFGQMPVAFRLNNMAMALQTDGIDATHLWALLVPSTWMDGHIHDAASVGTLPAPNLTVRRVLNKAFGEVASAVVDTMILSNSALIPAVMPVDNRSSSSSFFDYDKVRRTPEGTRLKIASLRKTASTSYTFAKMCLY